MSYVKDQILEAGFMRLPAILKVFPVAPSSWWRGVKEGKYPAPIKLSEHTTAWRAEDIRKLCEDIQKIDVQEAFKARPNVLKNKEKQDDLTL